MTTESRIPLRTVRELILAMRCARSDRMRLYVYDEETEEHELTDDDVELLTALLEGRLYAVTTTNYGSKEPDEGGHHGQD